ncbi:unnamed protein product [Boreogadus saida]
MRAADMADAMNTGFWEVRIGCNRHSPPRAAPRHGSSDLPLTITPPIPSQLDGVRGFTNPSLPSMTEAEDVPAASIVHHRGGRHYRQRTTRQEPAALKRGAPCSETAIWPRRKTQPVTTATASPSQTTVGIGSVVLRWGPGERCQLASAAGFSDGHELQLSGDFLFRWQRSRMVAQTQTPQLQPAPDRL